MAVASGGGCGGLGRTALRHNELTGTLPDMLWRISRMLLLDIAHNHVGGTLPGLGYAACSLKHLAMDENQLSGSVPDGIASFMAMERLQVRCNQFAGSLPDSLRALSRLKALSMQHNKLARSIPSCMWSMRALMSLSLELNKLTGSLPGALVPIPRLGSIYVNNNYLGGQISKSIRAVSGMRLLSHLGIAKNSFRGTLPESMGSLQSLALLQMDENAVAGTLPSELIHLKMLRYIVGSRNMFEGALPMALAALSYLYLLALCGGKEAGGRLGGPIMQELARIVHLDTLLASNHRLTGVIPAFKSSLDVLALHQNAFLSVPHLHVNSKSITMLHRNRLSCDLPSSMTLPASRMCLVALGNHLRRPSRDLAWISPFERDSLFWVDSSSGLLPAVQVAGGCCALALAFSWRVGLREYLSVTQMWHVVKGTRHPLDRMTSSLFALLAPSLVGSCLLVALVVDSSYYICPSALALASTCLAKSSLVQIVVVLLYGWLCLQARAWWGPRIARHEDSDVQSSIRVTRRALYWSLWIVLVLLLSQVLVLDMAAKCVPSFIAGGRRTVKLLDLGIGGFQALLSGGLVPLLAGRAWPMTLLNKPALVSVAGVLGNCILPCLVLLYLDSVCLGNWTRWWTACAKPDNFSITPMISLRGTSDFMVLRHTDVCNPSRRVSPAMCARSVALKLQGIVLGKLIMGTLVFPAVRLATRYLYRRSDTILVKLALHLEFGMLFGAPLPLIVPMLCMGVLTERLLAAASWVQENRQGLSDSSEEEVQPGVALACIWSVLFHICWVSGDIMASTVLFCTVLAPLVVVVLLRWVRLMRGLCCRQRHQRRCRQRRDLGRSSMRRKSSRAREKAEEQKVQARSQRRKEEESEDDEDGETRWRSGMD